MTKQFLEVFPTLKLDKKLQAQMQQVEVEGIAATRHRDAMYIKLLSNHLIDKDDIWKLEAEIKRQLFSNVKTAIHIRERFTLSEQYTPEMLLQHYFDSMLKEIRAYSPLMFNMLKRATYSVDGKKIVFTVDDIVPNHEKADEAMDILDKILSERCGLSVFTEFAYRPAKESRYKADDELKIARQIDQIVSKLPASGEQAEEKEDVIETPKEHVAAGSEMKQKKPVQTDNRPKSFAKNEGGRRDFRKPVKDDDPDVIYGRNFEVENEELAIEQIVGEMGEVIIKGQILSVDTREIRNEKTIIMFQISDYTDTIGAKIFAHNDQVAQIKEGIKAGAFVRIKGVTMFDKFDKDMTIGSIVGIKKIPDFRVSRQDYSAHKRVELHCHTKMSDMDGVSDAKAIVKQAYKWGHPAIAITDHGVAQAFPDAFHTWQDLWKEEKGKRKEAGDENPDRQDFFKVIYGIEAYLVDDMKKIVENPAGQSLQGTFVVFDIETTGFSAEKNHITEIGAVKVSGGKIVDRFSTFVNPKEPIPFRIQQLTNITDQDVAGAPDIGEVLPQFLAFCEDAVLVAHNARFDMSFIIQNAKNCSLRSHFTYLDTLGLSRVMLPGHNKYTLDAVCKLLGVSLENHHRAVHDAEATAEVFVKLLEKLAEESVFNMDDINALSDDNDEAISKLRPFHCIILAKNNVGRINMYRLISDSHLKYFNKVPKIPKSKIMQNREGLILGSACEAGELYQAILDDRSEQDIIEIANFYDYLEIQPVGNNAFMIESERVEMVNSIEDIQRINKQICDLGDQLGKPVCATCDVHFLNPEDEVYRRIIMTGKGFKDADNQAPLFLHTTDEMLEEFSYLGSDKAMEVVVTNTNKIADMIESIDPVRPDKCPPVIENSDELLREICNNKAHELYGPNLPKIVQDRLEMELHSIISNGFAVMYIIAQKLVWKSVEDGYLVGSRGSVGSSFVAYMAGITEVNSLSPHYRCGKCYFVDFDSPEVKAYSGKAGCDMPDRVCPNCGEKLIKDGFDIPFQTFLGFKGNKEPDIDLNFSGEYQSKAHKYTEVIFGYGQTFRAGTIGTLAEKTAYGFVKNYYEERGMSKRAAEINRIVQGCTGVRRSTGQHPGGIVVLPVGEDINSFTPVQHPANDMTTDIITTHFDYHSIDHNLLKLDILGHDDPTMIRMLQDLTDTDPTAIPLDDPDVMSLFSSTKALGITPEQIGGCELGSLGIPEFGTEFVIQMLKDTKPKSFSDLVRISGLSHGTDVWLGNAQTLIEEGNATISTAICTRDDIMIYLIDKGVESELSFTIMESVRKGKGLKPEMEAAMREHDVPDWYIWSCKKIKYMFPKAHAAAYVMMAWRIAYYKVNYPLAYYAAYFSIRASAFSYEIMCLGQAKLEATMKEYQKRKDTLSKKEQDTMKDMKIVQEMYARGFEFLPIDLFKSHSRLFQIVDGKLLPPFNSIDGLGDSAAENIMEAALDGPYLSRDDFKARTKASQTITDKMAELHLLGDLPQSNQISLFDMFRS